MKEKEGKGSEKIKNLSHKNSTPEDLTYIWHLKPAGIIIIAMMFEKMQIPFNSDGFTAVTVAEAP